MSIREERKQKTTDGERPVDDFNGYTLSAESVMPLIQIDHYAKDGGPGAV